jgi:putative endonuclease
MTKWEGDVMKNGYVYIMSNYKRTTLYTGVTNDLVRRVAEHKSGKGSVFASKYKCMDLLYYETYENIRDAINREKQIKNWHRDWKINTIKKFNPEMKDMFFEMLGEGADVDFKEG